MAANVDPYRRYRPIRLGIHVFATDDQSGESITVRNYDLPSPELARLRFEAARLACLRPADDDSPELVVELISGGKILDAFPMRRVTLPRLSVIIDPPPPPAGRYRVDLHAFGRLVDGIERELGRAATIEDAKRLYDDQAALFRGRLVVLRGGVPYDRQPYPPKRRQAARPGDLAADSYAIIRA